MSRINKTVEKFKNQPSSIHKNFMDGNSWDISNPFIKLRIVAASSFFGEPKYYDENGPIVIKDKDDFSFNYEKFKYIQQYLGKCIISPYDTNSFENDELISNSHNKVEEIIDECLNIDVEKTLQIAVQLRNEDLIRVVPQVILVRAAMNKNSKGTGLIVKYFDKICTRGDEPAAILSYLFSRYGDNVSIPNSLKKGLKKVLESFDNYVISKYKMERNFVKTVDVVNLVHAYSKPIDKLVKGNAKQERTWNAIVSNADKETKSKMEIWTKAMENMPHMALLRNLKNLIDNHVDEKLYLNKLLEGVEGGKQFPFRYYSAYKKLASKANPSILEVIEKCLNKSFVNAPYFHGNTAILSDNSGSAWGTLTSELGTMHIAEIGNLMAVMTGRMCQNATVGVFGDKLEMFELNKDESIFKAVNKLYDLGQHIGGGTENGIWLFFDKIIKNKIHYDNIFIYSDMQAGHGGLYGINKSDYKDYIFKVNDSDYASYIDVPKLINKYRQTVNKDVMVYLIQTAGYDDILVPECYDKTFILGGWSANIPLFAHKMSEIYNSMKGNN